jgi:hypothetical protein
MHLFEIVDLAMAKELGVDVETYIDVIENKCTEEEASIIIDLIWNEDTTGTAQQLFNSKLKQDDK